MPAFRTRWNSRWTPWTPPSGRSWLWKKRAAPEACGYPVTRVAIPAFRRATVRSQCASVRSAYAIRAPAKPDHSPSHPRLQMPVWVCFAAPGSRRLREQKRLPLWRLNEAQGSKSKGCSHILLRDTRITVKSMGPGTTCPNAELSFHSLDCWSRAKHDGASACRRFLPESLAKSGREA